MSSTSKVFALTGGIGTGKSTVARIWRHHGLAIVDADVLAREVVEPGSLGLAAVEREFGPHIITTEGQLDRAALGRIVFADPSARKLLGELLHPLVRAAATRRFAELEALGEALICYEIPLLFETGQALRLRPVVVVFAGEEQQLARIVERDGLSPEAARQRIAAQLPLAEKMAQADYLIDNGGTLTQTTTRALQLLARLRQSAEPGEPALP